MDTMEELSEEEYKAFLELHDQYEHISDDDKGDGDTNIDSGRSSEDQSPPPLELNQNKPRSPVTTSFGKNLLKVESDGDTNIDSGKSSEDQSPPPVELNQNKPRFSVTTSFGKNLPKVESDGDTNIDSGKSSEDQSPPPVELNQNKPRSPVTTSFGKNLLKVESDGDTNIDSGKSSEDQSPPPVELNQNKPRSSVTTSFGKNLPKVESDGDTNIDSGKSSEDQSPPPVELNQKKPRSSVTTSFWKNLPKVEKNIPSLLSKESGNRIEKSSKEQKKKSKKTKSKKKSASSQGRSSNRKIATNSKTKNTEKDDHLNGRPKRKLRHVKQHNLDHVQDRRIRTRPARGTYLSVETPVEKKAEIVDNFPVKSEPSKFEDTEKRREDRKLDEIKTDINGDGEQAPRCSDSEGVDQQMEVQYVVKNSENKIKRETDCKRSTCKMEDLMAELSQEEFRNCLKLHGYHSSNESSDSDNGTNPNFEEMYGSCRPPPIKIDPAIHRIIEIGPRNDQAASSITSTETNLPKVEENISGLTRNESEVSIKDLPERQKENKREKSHEDDETQKEIGTVLDTTMQKMEEDNESLVEGKSSELEDLSKNQKRTKKRRLRRAKKDETPTNEDDEGCDQSRSHFESATREEVTKKPDEGNKKNGGKEEKRPKKSINEELQALLDRVEALPTSNQEELLDSGTPLVRIRLDPRIFNEPTKSEGVQSSKYKGLSRSQIKRRRKQLQQGIYQDPVSTDTSGDTGGIQTTPKIVQYSKSTLDAVNVITKQAILKELSVFAPTPKTETGPKKQEETDLYPDMAFKPKPQPTLHPNETPSVLAAKLDKAFKSLEKLLITIPFDVVAISRTVDEYFSCCEVLCVDLLQPVHFFCQLIKVFVIRFKNIGKRSVVEEIGDEPLEMLHQYMADLRNLQRANAGNNLQAKVFRNLSVLITTTTDTILEEIGKRQRERTPVWHRPTGTPWNWGEASAAPNKESATPNKELVPLAEKKKSSVSDGGALATSRGIIERQFLNGESFYSDHYKTWQDFQRLTLETDTSVLFRGQKSVRHLAILESVTNPRSDEDDSRSLKGFHLLSLADGVVGDDSNSDIKKSCNLVHQEGNREDVPSDSDAKLNIVNDGLTSSGESHREAPLVEIMIPKDGICHKKPDLPLCENSLVCNLNLDQTQDCDNSLVETDSCLMHKELNLIENPPPCDVKLNNLNNSSIRLNKSNLELLLDENLTEDDCICPKEFESSFCENIGVADLDLEEMGPVIQSEESKIENIERRAIDYPLEVIREFCDAKSLMLGFISFVLIRKFVQFLLHYLDFDVFSLMLVFMYFCIYFVIKF